MARTVLLADDVAYMRKGLRIILEQYGLTVLEACNGVDAVHMVQERAVDLIVMDWEMPRMNGLEATRSIRAIGYTVPIIAYTSHDFPEDVSQCLAAGMNGHISKAENVLLVIDKLMAAFEQAHVA